MSPIMVALVALLAALQLHVVDAIGDPTPRQKDAIIYWHNKARSNRAIQGRCSNMLEVEWDLELAAASQTNDCFRTHNRKAGEAYLGRPGAYVGENLAWGSSRSCASGSGLSPPFCGGEGQPKCEQNSQCTMKGPIYDRWYISETVGRDTNSPCCSESRCGHCTAVQWQNVEKVGCTVQNKRCSDQWNTRMACNYYPPSNYGSDPCQKGPACSKCPPTHPHCTAGGDNPGLCSKYPKSPVPGSSAPIGPGTESIPQPPVNNPAQPPSDFFPLPEPAPQPAPIPQPPVNNPVQPPSDFFPFPEPAPQPFPIPQPPANNPVQPPSDFFPFPEPAPQPFPIPQPPANNPVQPPLFPLPEPAPQPVPVSPPASAPIPGYGSAQALEESDDTNVVAIVVPIVVVAVLGLAGLGVYIYMFRRSPASKSTIAVTPMQVVVTRSKPAPPGRPPPPSAAVSSWETNQDDDGNIYYFNAVTGISQWERPY